VADAPTLSDKKRAAILRAAAETFRKEGFYATTMDRVAERAAVSKRTVYNHFPSKDVLFDVVTDQLWGRLVPDEEAAPDRQVSVEARLRAIARRRLDALLDPDLIGLLRVVLGESVRSPELARAYVGVRDRQAQLGLRALLREEVARGRLAIDRLDLAAGLFWGLALGPLFWPLVLGLRGSPDATEREIVVNETVAVFLARYGVSKRRPAGAPRKRKGKRS
jgi:TetR/AcrR family transcriptional regulator of autoinduction and epiphytic fitness